MSFIAVDLKIIEVQAPGLARALGLEVPFVIGSLSLLWHRCWSIKSDAISTLELRGYFTSAEAGPLLAAFGLLEAAGDGWRVKGADRYLRITEQRSNAGKTRAADAKRAGGRFTSAHQRATSTPPAAHQRTTSGAPADDQRATSGGPALTPSTEHRAPNTEKKEDLVDHPLKAVWNDNRAPSMPAWTATGKKRKSHADARLKERPPEEWAPVVQRLAASDFASGRSGKWTATVDWLLGSPDNATKTLEGAYDNRGPPTRAADVRAPAPVANWSLPIEETSL